jgi:hypothetical protein
MRSLDRMHRGASSTANLAAKNQLAKSSLKCRQLVQIQSEPARATFMIASKREKPRNSQRTSSAFP